MSQQAGAQLARRKAIIFGQSSTQPPHPEIVYEKRASQSKMRGKHFMLEPPAYRTHYNEPVSRGAFVLAVPFAQSTLSSSLCMAGVILLFRSCLKCYSVSHHLVLMFGEHLSLYEIM